MKHTYHTTAPAPVNTEAVQRLALANLKDDLSKLNPYSHEAKLQQIVIARMEAKLRVSQFQ